MGLKGYGSLYICVLIHTYHIRPRGAVMQLTVRRLGVLERAQVYPNAGEIGLDKPPLICYYLINHKAIAENENNKNGGKENGKNSTIYEGVCKLHKTFNFK